MWLHTEPRAAQASGWFKNDIQHDSMQSFYAHSVYLANKIAGDKLSNPITFLFILHAIIIGCLFFIGSGKWTIMKSHNVVVRPLIKCDPE